MKLSEYQQKAARTRAKDLSDREHLFNGGLGAAGEAGEVANKVKKYVFHRHIDSRAAIYEEIGDVLWYLADLCTTLEVSLDFVAQDNIDKLLRRYPDGFSSERSINRDNGQPSSIDTAGDLDDEHNVYTDGPIFTNGGGFAYAPRGERLVLSDFAEGSGVE